MLLSAFLRYLIRQNADRLKGKIGYDVIDPQALRSLLDSFLQQNPPKKSPIADHRWVSVLDSFAHPEQKHDVYYVDTEFFGHGATRTLLEVAVYSYRGEKLFSSTVDHETTVADMFSRATNNGKASSYTQQINVGSVRKVYGLAPTDSLCQTTRTKGKTLRQIDSALGRIGISLISIIIEWSTSNIDYHVLTQAFPSANFPPKRNWLKAIPMWRAVLPGFVTFALEHAFPIFFPHLAVEMRDHHRADIDTRKLFLMVEELVRYLRP